MKAKSILAALLLMVAGIQSAAAQGFRVYKSDGTVAQFSFRTDSIVFYDGIGSDVDFGPFTPVNQCIVGTWYKTKSEAFTFNEDGTTDYLDGATYEFLPYQGTLIINNAEGKLTKLLRVPKVTKDYIVLSEWGGETFAFLTAEQPGQLVTGITVNPATLNMKLGETTAITATVLPADADNKEVEWSSSDEAVAVVGDFFGTITVMAKGYGTCTITATAKDGSGVKGECQVTIAQLVTSITISPATLTLEPGKTQTLKATIQPSDATNKAVTWTSSNTSVVTVSTSGKVTAKAAGTSTITATAKDGSGVKGTCKVTVKETGINGHAFVEIGGLKWATMNIGATTVAGSYETCYGDYYAWGQIVPQYSSITRTSASEATFTWKTGYESGYGKWPTYKETTLDATHDAATVQFGEGWRTPTEKDFEALANACGSHEWIIHKVISGGIYWLDAEQTYEPEYTGVAGVLFVDKSDISKRVFFPAAGNMDGTNFKEGGTKGCYWSSNRSGDSYHDCGCCMEFGSTFFTLEHYNYARCRGCTVRPVSD